MTLLKKRLVVLREELLSLEDNKDKELENGKVKKLSYKRKKIQSKLIKKNFFWSSFNFYKFYFNPYCAVIYNLWFSSKVNITLAPFSPYPLHP